MEAIKDHWEHIYQTKNLKEVSWYQDKPKISLELIKSFNLTKEASIIDVGGGDANLADYLLKVGFENISVLDISQTALDQVKNRLGKKAKNLKFIQADAADFQPEEKYHLWHDRATVHFLTEGWQIKKYLKTLKDSVVSGGYVILATFSEKGPVKCSGRKIKQYSIEDMKELLSNKFENLECRNIDHTTPSGVVQNFTFCSFMKK